MVRGHPGDLQVTLISTIPMLALHSSSIHFLLRSVRRINVILVKTRGWRIFVSPGHGIKLRILTVGSVLLTLGRGLGEAERERQKQWEVRNAGAAETLPHGVPRFQYGITGFQNTRVTSLDSSLYICSPPVPSTVNNWKEYNRVRIIVASPPLPFIKSFYIRGVWPQPLLAL